MAFCWLIGVYNKTLNLSTSLYTSDTSSCQLVIQEYPGYRASFSWRGFSGWLGTLQIITKQDTARWARCNEGNMQQQSALYAPSALVGTPQRTGWDSISRCCCTAYTFPSSFLRGYKRRRMFQTDAGRCYISEEFVWLHTKIIEGCDGLLTIRGKQNRNQVQCPADFQLVRGKKNWR
jgi:hypothetical protein